MFSNTTSSYNLCLKPSPVNAPYGLMPHSCPGVSCADAQCLNPQFWECCSPFPRAPAPQTLARCRARDALTAPGMRLQRHGLASLRRPSGFSLSLAFLHGSVQPPPCLAKAAPLVSFFPQFILGSGVSADTGTVQGACSMHPAASERSPSLPAPRRALHRGRSCRRRWRPSRGAGSAGSGSCHRGRVPPLPPSRRAAL